jgi:hypothetical protein
MSKNFIMLAQNNKKYDYTMQAALCALSIKYSNPDASVALVTDDNVFPVFRPIFDHIVNIPWSDEAADTEWKIENRWKIIHASPYDEAVILDTDMLILDDISAQYEYMQNYNIFFTTDIKDYRGNIVTSDFYRKNNATLKIPTLYTALSYFDKSKFSYDFYNQVGEIINNWDTFNHSSGVVLQKTPSMDTAVGLAAKILDCENQITPSAKVYGRPTFTHMKPNIQGWSRLTESWQDKVSGYFNPKFELFLGNYKQTGIVHYSEKSFIKHYIVKQYCDHFGVAYDF